MSTSPVQVESVSSWKQEVNRRLAEHKGRKGASPIQQHAATDAHHAASRRAQEAAARVAARYAKAPSYSEVLANEAMAALRAAEAASKAAMEAQAAMQSVLAGIEAASAIEPAAMLQLVEAPPLPQSLDEPVTAFTPEPPAFVATEEVEASQPALASASPVEPVSVRWEQDLPVRSSLPAELRATRGNDLFEERGWKPASAEPLAPGAGEVEVVEPAQPIQGNVIEFPRELVATRKARPRLGESPQAEPESGLQLSIFEVDPATLPEQPALESAATASEAWTAPKWSGIELDAQPLDEFEQCLNESDPLPAQAPALEPAAAGWRLMAIVMDSTLIAGAVLGAGIMALHRMPALPSLRATELGAGLALVVFAALYQMLFFTLGKATPGMKYAHLQLCAFDGYLPTPAQRSARLVAMLLSVLPAGLGLAWAVFDEDHLSWHDRLSRTYLRRA